MRKKVSTLRAAKGKARERQDAETAERVKAILSDPNTSERVKGKLRRAINELGEWTTATVEETPDFFAGEFREGAAVLRVGTLADFHRRKAGTFYERVVRLAEKHEPKDARTVRRLADILRSPTREQRDTILTAINDLHNEGDVDDLHPEIFPTLAAVVIREARKRGKGRSHTAGCIRRALAELEAIADEKGGAR